MGRLLIILGAVLMVVAIVFLFWILQGPSNEGVANLLTSLHCRGDEQIVQWFGNQVRTGTGASGGYGRETAFYCETSSGAQREVTLPVIATMAGGFVVPFLASLCFLIIGPMIVFGRGMKRFVGNVTQQPLSGMQGTRFQVQPGTTHVIDLRHKTMNRGELSPDVAQKVEQAFSILDQMGFPTDNVNIQTSGSVESGESGTLRQRLQQLEEARNSGLIDETEYQRLRQTLLDNLTE